jgi:hypothetical protein
MPMTLTQNGLFLFVVNELEAGKIQVMAGMKALLVIMQNDDVVGLVDIPVTAFARMKRQGIPVCRAATLPSELWKNIDGFYAAWRKEVMLDDEVVKSRFYFNK